MKFITLIALLVVYFPPAGSAEDYPASAQPMNIYAGSSFEMQRAPKNGDSILWVLANRENPGGVARVQLCVRSMNEFPVYVRLSKRGFYYFHDSVKTVLSKPDLVCRVPAKGQHYYVEHFFPVETLTYAGLGDATAYLEVSRTPFEEAKVTPHSQASRPPATPAPALAPSTSKPPAAALSRVTGGGSTPPAGKADSSYWSGNGSKAPPSQGNTAAKESSGGKPGGNVWVDDRGGSARGSSASTSSTPAHPGAEGGPGGEKPNWNWLTKAKTQDSPAPATSSPAAPSTAQREVAEPVRAHPKLSELRFDAGGPGISLNLPREEQEKQARERDARWAAQEAARRAAPGYKPDKTAGTISK